MERETTELKIAGHTLVVKTYLTGREMREVTNKYSSAVKMDMGMGGTPTMKDIDLTVSGEAEDLKIKLAVVSFDGKTENISDLLLDLPNDDYVAVTKAVFDLIEKKTQ